MKDFKFYAILIAALLLFGQNSAFAQETEKKQAERWIRVQSDNGEFSVEVPDNSDYLFDAEGFDGQYNNDIIRLKNMSLLNAFTEKTLLSFEVYEGDADALSGDVAADKKAGAYSEINFGGAPIKQIITKTAEFYSVRWYFNSKKHVYIMTAATRTGETPAMKRFLNSLVFKPDSTAPAAKIPTFARLKKSKVEIALAPKKTEKKPENAKTNSNNSTPKPVGTPKPAAASLEKTTVKPLVIVSKLRSAYTESARLNKVTGRVVLSVNFAPNGGVRRISVVDSLPDGLTRQAIFSALRLKFLPSEENGKPVERRNLLVFEYELV